MEQTHEAIGLLREGSGEERLEMALRLSEDARVVRRSGIRARDPEYSDAEVDWTLFRGAHGDELSRRAWPDAPRLSP